MGGAGRVIGAKSCASCGVSGGGAHMAPFSSSRKEVRQFQRRDPCPSLAFCTSHLLFTHVMNLIEEVIGGSERERIWWRAPFVCTPFLLGVGRTEYIERETQTGERTEQLDSQFFRPACTCAPLFLCFAKCSFLSAKVHGTFLVRWAFHKVTMSY